MPPPSTVDAPYIEKERGEVEEEIGFVCLLVFG